MVRSMTGYGRVQQTRDVFNVLVEIKSVNHRFFEFNARVPRLYGYVEEKIKSFIQQYISRGKVDVFVVIEEIERAGAAISLNHQLAQSYITALGELQRKYDLDSDISVSTVARYTDIFTVLKSPDDEQRVWKALEPSVEQAVGECVKMREAEGERLRADIVGRAEYIYGLVEEVEDRSPETVSEYRAKLTARMKEILEDSKIDENRLLLEAAIYADKISVTEETVRLKSHLRQFEAMLGGGEQIGRKLDFLMQEMNREANTIGSKASDIEIAGVVVNIKAELEKIREQIQNIE